MSLPLLDHAGVRGKIQRDPRPAAEGKIHAAIVDLLSYAADRRLLYHHPPNELARDVGVIQAQLALGMLPGVPDLCLTLPDGRSAFMEIKTSTGRLRLEQKVFRLICEERGFPYALVRSLDDAERALRSWGALRRERKAA